MRKGFYYDYHQILNFVIDSLYLEYFESNVSIVDEFCPRMNFKNISEYMPFDTYLTADIPYCETDIFIFDRFHIKT